MQLRLRDIKFKRKSVVGTVILEYNKRQTRTGENMVDIRKIKPKMFERVQEIRLILTNYMQSTDL